MVTISITRLRVRLLRYLPGFLYYSFRSFRQAKSAPGNLGAGLLREANNVYWTRTAWRDEASMRAFMLTAPHRSVMPKLLDWCNEAALVHWTQESENLPDWQEAHRRLVSEGRRSKVRNPTPAHESFTIAPPNAGS